MSADKKFQNNPKEEIFLRLLLDKLSKIWGATMNFDSIVIHVEINEELLEKSESIFN